MPKKISKSPRNISPAPPHHQMDDKEVYENLLVKVETALQASYVAAITLEKTVQEIQSLLADAKEHCFGFHCALDNLDK